MEEAPLDDTLKKPDPNALKFIPGLVHLRKDILTSAQQTQLIINYTSTMKAGESFSLIFEDNQFDSRSGDLVDFAFGASAGYINLTGFGKPEKSAKVNRYQYLLEVVNQMS